MENIDKLKRKLIKEQEKEREYLLKIRAIVFKSKQLSDKGGKLISKDNKRALYYLNKAIQYDNQNLEAWANKGIVFFRLKKYAKAIDAFKEALKLESNDDKIYSFLADSYHYHGQEKESLENLKKAIQLNPNSFYYAISIAETLDHKFKRYKEALQYYKKAEQLDKDSLLYENMGMCYGKQFRYKEAIECFNKAIRLDKKNYRAWHDKGYALFCLKKYDEALKCFNQSLKIRSKDSDSWEWKGYTLIKKKKWKEALMTLKKAEKLDPKNKEIKKQIKYLFLKLKRRK